MKGLTLILAATALISVTAVSHAQYSWSKPTRSHGDRGRCIGHLPQAISEGWLASGEYRVVHAWSTTCHSAFTASASGVTIYVQRMTGEKWINLAVGISANIQDLGPGTYRIVAYNNGPLRTKFKVRHHQGLG